MTTVACDFDYHETKHISHYTYSVAKVVLNTSVQIVITLYSDEDIRWGKNIIFVLEGEDYSKWTDDSYITEAVAKKVAGYMPQPPTPLPPIPEEEIKEEPKVETPCPIEREEVIPEEPKVETPCPIEREEVIPEEPQRKVVAKKTATRSKKATPIATPIAVMT
jgi:hypothetical protein